MTDATRATNCVPTMLIAVIATMRTSEDVVPRGSFGPEQRDRVGTE